MNRSELAQLPRGTRIWRWWDNGIEAEQNPFTLIRTNPATVTVENNRGEYIYLRHAEIIGVVDWDETGRT